MNANPKFLSATAHVDEAAVKSLPNSRKVYVEGSRPDIRVPMREISQADTPTQFGGEANPPIYVYDTSGPYTDPDSVPDIRQGLPAIRRAWVLERGDVEEYAGRGVTPQDDGYFNGREGRTNNEPFPGLKRLPLRAKDGRIVNVSSGGGLLSAIGASHPAYSVSKAALNALTVALAADLGPQGIMVNAVCPGWIATDMGASGGEPAENGGRRIVECALLPRGAKDGRLYMGGRPVDW